MDYTDYIKSLPKQTATKTILNNPEVISYIRNIYPDIDDISISISAIRRGFSPYCVQCNKVKNDIRKTTCSHKCSFSYLKSTGKYEQYVKTRMHTYKNKHGSGTESSILIAAKTKATRNAKYGKYTSPKGDIACVENMRKLNSVLPEIIMNKYGVSNVSQLDDVKEKKKKTLYENYSVTSIFNIQKYVDERLVTRMRFYENFSKHGEVIEFSVDSKYNSESFVFKCYTCETIEVIPRETFKWRSKKDISPCKVCEPYKESFFEHQVKEFVISIYPNVIPNDRTKIKPKELDLYFPELNKAIECNGEYWHQDEQKEEDKLEACKKVNIELLVIWQKEWDDFREETKTKIKEFIEKKKGS